MYPLSTLIYCSRVSGDLNVAGLYDIQEYSNRYNSARDITGMMVFNSRYFLQAIEGPHTHILVLRDKIQRDKRHRNFAALGHEKMQARTWANWSMNLVTPSPANQKIFEQFNTLDGLDPYRLTFSQAHSLLLQLAQHVLIPHPVTAMNQLALAS